MSDTLKRILSAAVLIIILLLTIYGGVKASLGLVLAIGVLIVDEMHGNFFHQKRFSLKYFLAQALFLLPFLGSHLLAPQGKVQEILTYGSLMVNLGLVFYLLYSDPHSAALKAFCQKYSFLAGLFVLLPLISLTSVFYFPKWQVLLGALLVANFGMDTGAWFFGRTWGKHKLWPAVSPHKTIEGLIGGMFTAGVAGGWYWCQLVGPCSVQLFFLFMALGFISQVGDLIQSKIKRQFNLKDSSSLIPGHGGVYDRVDGLIFVSPFYATALRFLHHF